MDVRCKRCYRVLTDPNSIEVGYGYTCYKKEFGRILKIKEKQKLNANCKSINQKFMMYTTERWEQLNLLDFGGDENGNYTH